MFGETTKELNKSQIINWKNKKECEVKISFNKGDSKYIIHRGIKPNFIKLYKNDSLVDQLASNVDMQKYIEDNILEIDYETFVSIIHYNPTTSKSIFNVQKGQKRSFIEKIFGLEMYSDISNRCNKEISTYTSKISDSEKIKELTFNEFMPLNNQIGLIESDIEHDKREYEHNLNKLYEKKKSIYIDTNELEEYESKLKIILNKIDKYEELNLELNKNIDIIKEKILLLNVKDNNFNDDNYKNVGKKLNSLKKLYIEDISEFKSTIENLEKENSSLLSEISNISMEITKLNIELENNNKLCDGVCPLCNNEIDKAELSEKITNCSNKIENNKSDIEKYNEKIKLNKQKIKELKLLIDNNIKVNSEINELKNEFIKLSYEKKEYDNYIENKNKIEKLNEDLVTYNTSIKDNIKEIQKLEKLKDLLETKINVVDLNKKELEKINSEIELQEKLLIEKEKKYVEMQKIIDSNKNKLVEIKRICNEESNKILEYKEEIEYYEYIKRICKDENVKQYAISNMVPFLSRQVNGYLSDAGFNFYLKFDSWLNVEVKGPGIREAGFGNLSSGQQKTTNLAMILSFLDISKMQTSSFPDVLLLDEILDGAIDSITLTQMFNIIAKKQKEDNLKLFIVSHRKEINEIGKIDNIYKIEMQDGFSKISQTES